MRTKAITVERKIARVAGRQHGNVTRAQLLETGLSADAIKRRVAKGSLLPQYRGVYRVGHAAGSIDADYMAAVLACGAGAVLSGRAAAYLHRVLPKAAPPEVTAPTARRVAGLKTRRGKPRATRVRGIPVTTVPQTLVDLAAVLVEDELARACHEAGVKYRTTPREVKAVLPSNASGAATLRRILEGETRVVLSELEKRFLDMLRDAGLPLPVTNKPAGSKRVDCRWPDRALTVELDSYRFHNSRHAWKRDRLREREARARGDEFRRYCWDDLPQPALRELTPLLR